MLGGTGFALSMRGPLSGLSNALNTAVTDSTVPISQMNRPHREFDRYSKLDQNPISIDRVPVKIPRRVRETRFQTYQYTALPYGVNDAPHIRVLEILSPTEHGDEDFIWCRVHSRSLYDACPFEALSYTWGTLARDVPILVHSDSEPEPQALLVTPQLYAALKRLRLESRSRMIWIDQCCINQSNDVEKGLQVHLMGEIYKEAERTTIWLGESDEHVHHVQELTRALNEADSANGEPAPSDVAVLQDMVGVKQPRSGVCMQRLNAVTSFLNRDWFTRAWVFQEAVLSKNLGIRCGDSEWQFNILKRMADAVCDIQYNDGGYARSLASTTVGFDTLDLIQHSRKECTRAECKTSVSENFLALLLKVLLQCKATNDRDLVYAFLAFQDPSKQEAIKPDYTSTVEAAWTDAAVYIIKSSRSLDLFCAASGGRRPGLPSWVPDWRHCYGFGRPFAAPDMKSDFRAGGMQHCWQDPEPSEVSTPRLLVKGKIIDHIDWFSPWNFEAAYYKDVSLQEFVGLDRHVETLRGYLKNQRGMSGDDMRHLWPDLEADVLRTLLADGAFGRAQPLPPIADVIGAYRKSGGSEDTINVRQAQGDIDNRLHEWVLILQKKRLFVSKKFQLGLAPRDAHRNGATVGNMVVLLEGSRTPCLLNALEGGCYQLVSQCYLDGWMYMAPRNDTIISEPETFILV
jgi:hypothetical protein